MQADSAFERATDPASKTGDRHAEKWSEFFEFFFHCGGGTRALLSPLHERFHQDAEWRSDGPGYRLD